MGVGYSTEDSVSVGAPAWGGLASCRTHRTRGRSSVAKTAMQAGSKASRGLSLQPEDPASSIAPAQLAG